LGPVERAFVRTIVDLRAADASLAKLLAFVREPDTPQAWLETVLANGLPSLGRHGRVDDALNLLIACAARGVLPPYDWLVTDTRLAALRADPRFAVIREKARAEFTAMLKDVEAARARGEFPAYLEQALAALTEALRLDANLAPAAAEAAILNLFAMEAGAPPAETLPKVVRWADTAVRIDPRNGRAWAARGAAEIFQAWPDISRVREYAIRAAALAPRDPLVQNGFGIDSRLGNTLHTVIAREACRLDPLHIGAASVAAHQMYVGGRSREALPYLDAANQVEPHAPLLLWNSPVVLADVGRVGEAEADLARSTASKVGCRTGFAPSRLAASVRRFEPLSQSGRPWPASESSAGLRR
jgi:tetratricopeptide (TPR) repeat protein